MTPDGGEPPAEATEATVGGSPLRSYPVALTTESLALAWARRENAPEGALVTATRELTPRQRKGPPWVPDPRGGLYLSMVLRPDLGPDGEGLLWMAACVGAARGLEALGIQRATIKWPDDVAASTRKLAGVKVISQLGPGRIESAIVTIRINLNLKAADLSGDLADRATSVFIETGAGVTAEEALPVFVAPLRDAFRLPSEQIADEYRARCDTLGRSVRAALLPRGEVIGEASDVSDGGALLIRSGARTIGVEVGTVKRLEYLIPSGT